MINLHNYNQHFLERNKFDNKTEEEKVKKKKIILPAGMASVFRFATESLGVFWAIYFAEKGLSGAQVGTIFALLTITGLFITLPSGFISDRFKAKYMIMAGVGLTIIQFYFSSLTGTFWILAFLFLIGGLGQNIHNTSIDSIFYKNLSKDLKDKEIGFYLSLRFLLSGLGVIVGGIALSFFDFTAVLKAMSVFLIILIFLSFKLPDTKSSAVSLKSYGKDIFKKEILLFTFTIFLFALHSGVELTTLGPFLKTAQGLNSQSIGFYIGLGIMSMAWGARYASRKLQNKKISPYKLLAIGLYMSAIGLFLIAHPQLAVSFLGRLLHVCGDAFIIVVLYHDVSSFFPAEHIGGDASLITLMLISGTFAGSLIFGFAGGMLGYGFTIAFGSFSTFLALFLAMYQRRMTERKIILEEKEA